MESKAQQRLEVLNNQIANNKTFNTSKLSPPGDDDIVIVGFARTAMTKAKRGNQKDTMPEAMLCPVFKAALEMAKVDPKLVEDICVGNVL